MPKQVIFILLLITTVFDLNGQSKTTNYYALKTDVFDYINGNFNIYCEKAFTDLFGIEIGLGLTSKNILYTILSNPDMNSTNQEFLWSGKSSNPSHIFDNNDYSWTYHTELNYGFAYSASVCPKFYLSQDPIEGSYIGLQMSYRKHNISSTNKMNESRAMNISRLNATLNYGFKYEVSNAISSEYFIGAGLAFVSELKNVTYINNLTNQTGEGAIYWSPIRMHIAIGIMFVLKKD